jgi:hypothetical protein
MTIPQAMSLLVRKVTAEQRDETDAALTEEYELALKQYPAVMSVAQYLVAIQYEPNLWPLNR